MRSIVCLPRWLLVLGVTICACCIAGGLALAIWAIATQTGGSLGGALGGAFGCIVGGAGGPFGVLCDARRRLPAPPLLAHLQNDAPSPFYRFVFWPALALAAIGIVIGNYMILMSLKHLDQLTGHRAF